MDRAASSRRWRPDQSTRYAARLADQAMQDGSRTRLSCRCRSWRRPNIPAGAAGGIACSCSGRPETELFTPRNRSAWSGKRRTACGNPSFFPTGSFEGGACLATRAAAARAFVVVWPRIADEAGSTDHPGGGPDPAQLARSRHPGSRLNSRFGRLRPSRSGERTRVPVTLGGDAASRDLPFRADCFEPSSSSQPLGQGCSHHWMVDDHENAMSGG